jgi:hypothetical protein
MTLAEARSALLEQARRLRSAARALRSPTAAGGGAATVWSVRRELTRVQRTLDSLSKNS